MGARSECSEFLVIRAALWHSLAPWARGLRALGLHGTICECPRVQRIIVTFPLRSASKWMQKGLKKGILILFLIGTSNVLPSPPFSLGLLN